MFYYFSKILKRGLLNYSQTFEQKKDDNYEEDDRLVIIAMSKKANKSLKIMNLVLVKYVLKK